jgi:hypothetical protein
MCGIPAKVRAADRQNTAAANGWTCQQREAAMTQTTLRRDALLAALVSALPIGLARSAAARPLDPSQTIIRKPDELQWKSNPAFSEPTVDNCLLVGDTTKAGLYYTLIRWWPGFMSAPHHYDTDRYCVVVSGTWWCNSGADFDPGACVPVPAGSFVHRVAGTPHYDGVIRGHPEPAIIAICGIGPVNLAVIDPSKPLVRRV